MNTQHTAYPYVTLSPDARILACELRGETHESLACLAANLTVQRNELLAALRDVMNGQIGGQPDMNAERFQRARAAIADTNNWE